MKILDFILEGGFYSLFFFLSLLVCVCVFATMKKAQNGVCFQHSSVAQGDKVV